MGRAVILRHELPDGSHHFDLLIDPQPAAGEGASGDPDERTLIAWRLSAWPDVEGGAVDAERLPAHRRLYLDYEGPISGGRGSVRREAAGEASGLEESPDRFAAALSLGDKRFRMEAVRLGGARWTVQFSRAAEDA